MARNLAVLYLGLAKRREAKRRAGAGIYERLVY